MKTKTNIFLDKVLTKNNPNHFNEDGTLRYGYNKVDYKQSKIKIVLTCFIHGDFEQLPDNHLRGQGCMACKVKNHAKTSEEFIRSANLKHDGNYEYTKTFYNKAIEKIIITCQSHGDFIKTPNAHLKGEGCPKCANLERGWNKESFRKKCIKNNKGLGVIYIIRCFNESESFYKIGITSNSIKTRYKDSIPYTYEVIAEVNKEPDEVFNIENELLKELAQYSYKPLISFNGKTECFKDTLSVYEVLISKIAA